MTAAGAPSAEHRDTCYDCLRPSSQCYCARLPRIQNRTKVLILQHPRERGHAIGTARMAHLSLANSELWIDYNRRFASERPPLPAGCGLLYPGPDATPLSGLSERQRPQALVVLDGTWHHARYMYRDCQWLHQLPRYSLSLSKPSNYRLRKEPAAHCVSTVEAIVAALKELEPDLVGLSSLLNGFDSMIDQQIAMLSTRSGESRYKQRRLRPRNIPLALLEPTSKIVVTYADYTTLADGSDALLSWNAHRLGTGETFGSLVAHEPAVGEARYNHLRVARSLFEQAPDFSALRQRWQSFAKPDDVFVAWNARTHEHLDHLGVTGAGRVTLKTAYLNLGRHRGSLDDVVVAEGLSEEQGEVERMLLESHDPVACFVQGRAAQRLANAIVMTRSVRAPADHQ